MIAIPSFKKKLAIVAVLGAMAVGAFVLVRGPNGKFVWQPSFWRGSAIVEKTVTIEDYQLAASTAVKGFVAGDASSVQAVLAKLQELRVPRDGMKKHFFLVTTLAAYSDALSAGKESAAATALSKLQDFSRSESWLGLST